MVWRNIVGSLLVVSLAACTVVGPDYVAPQLGLSGAFGNAGGGPETVKPQTRWWERFSDGTLNRLVEAGLAQNLDLAQALERVVQARETAIANGISGLPQVTASGNVSYSGSSAAPDITTTTSGGFDASWEIDLFGKLARGREAAQADIEMAVEDANNARATLIGEIAQTYVSARGYQARIAIARSSLASLQQTEELTRLQLEVGAGTSLDVLQASGDVSSTAANIPSLEISLAESIHALGVLTGQEPSALGGLFESSVSVPVVSASISPGIPADLVRNRPDIRSAERALAAATARIGVAEADLYPSFSLTGTLTALASTAASTSWSFAPGIDLPIFNAGARKAAVNLAESSAREQYFAYRQAVLSAMEEVENALVAYGKQGERRAHLAQSVASYSEAVELLSTSYEDGNASLLELLTAQSSLYSAQDALVQANAALAAQYVALCKALGGGWDIAASAR